MYGTCRSYKITGAFLRCSDDLQLKCIFHKQSGSESEINVKAGSESGAGSDKNNYGCTTLVILSDLEPLLTLHFWLFGSISFPRGLYFCPKMIFIPPPFWKWYFFPLSRHVVFRLLSWPFFLNSSLFCICFTLLLPLFSFSFPFLPFSFPFLPFSFTFSPFFSLPFHIFSPKWHGLIFPPPRGGGVFSII